MKKIKIPFSLEEYQKGDYEVEDGHGRSVRIGFTDAKCNHQPIMALVENMGEELTRFYYKDGRYSTNGTSSEDLFLIKYEFEDGDVVYTRNSVVEMISIFKDFDKCEDGSLNGTISVNAVISWGSRFKEQLEMEGSCDAVNIRPATEEEKKKLFDALATQKGLKWNAEIKDFEKIEKKIELKPKDFELVRDDNNDTWELDIFGRITKDPWCEFTYICVSGSFAYCIPFNSETEHSLGKTEDCPEKYK